MLIVMYEIMRGFLFFMLAIHLVMVYSRISTERSPWNRTKKTQLSALSYKNGLSTIDYHPYCCFWAANDECDKNIFYMRTKCQQSCGTVGCTMNNAPLCTVNVNEHCKQAIVDDSDKISHKLSDVCKDNHDLCCFMARTTNCEDDQSMEVNCPRACGFCDCTGKTNKCGVSCKTKNGPTTHSKSLKMFCGFSASNNSTISESCKIILGFNLPADSKKKFIFKFIYF